MGMRNSTDFLNHDLTPGVQNLSSTKKKLDLIFYKESAMKAGRINRSIHETDFFLVHFSRTDFGLYMYIYKRF